MPNWQLWTRAFILVGDVYRAKVSAINAVRNSFGGFVHSVSTTPKDRAAYARIEREG